MSPPLPAEIEALIGRNDCTREEIEQLREYMKTDPNAVARHYKFGRWLRDHVHIIRSMVLTRAEAETIILRRDCGPADFERMSPVFNIEECWPVVRSKEFADWLHVYKDAIQEWKLASK